MPPNRQPWQPSALYLPQLFQQRQQVPVSGSGFQQTQSLPFRHTYKSQNGRPQSNNGPPPRYRNGKPPYLANLLTSHTKIIAFRAIKIIKIILIFNRPPPNGRIRLLSLKIPRKYLIRMLLRRRTMAFRETKSSKMNLPIMATMTRGDEGVRTMPSSA